MTSSTSMDNFNSHPPIGHVNNIPTIQFFIGISRNTQSKSNRLCMGIPK